MKIAAFSDVHGNYLALASVIRDILLQGADKTICLGDIVLGGPQPHESVTKIEDMISYPECACIQGNTDFYLGNNSKQIFDKINEFSSIMANAYDADVALLSEHELNFLKKLPSQKEYVVDNFKILFVHGSPRANNENILPNLPIEKIEEMVVGTDADLILCGHTHIPCGYQTNSGQTVVNVGSVGRPLDGNPKACYCIIDIQDSVNKIFTVTHKRVDYDIQKAIELMRARNFDGANELADSILKGENI